MFIVLEGVKGHALSTSAMACDVLLLTERRHKGTSTAIKIGSYGAKWMVRGTRKLAGLSPADNETGWRMVLAKLKALVEDSPV